jgi:hypothetical protein
VILNLSFFNFHLEFFTYVIFLVNSNTIDRARKNEEKKEEIARQFSDL